jgi:hypothetical protein
MKSFFVFVVSLFSIANVAAQNNLQLNYSGEIVLNDSIEDFYQSSISQFKVDSGFLYITSNDLSAVSKYSLNTGNQTAFFEFYGRGPYEMENLYNLTVSDTSLYLLDYSGKIVGLNNTTGIPFLEINPKISRVKEILFYENGFIIGQEAPGTKTYLSKINFTTEEIEAFGAEQFFENVLLSAFITSGKMIRDESTLHTLMPFGNDLYTYNLSDLSRTDITELKIPDFASESLTLPNNIYLQDPTKIQDFFSNNSLVTGFFRMKHGYIIEVLHMHLGYQRAVAYLDSEFELLCYTPVSEPEIYDGTQDPKIRFSDGEFLYYYREEIDQTKEDSAVKILRYFEPVCK